ncbi:MAG TPA: hypothetical protein VNE40_01595 [Candidatus Dormibacteraeota bacterium]|nr:hypothetical protein [Candidatus Dormibacteraeota bacterium]
MAKGISYCASRQDCDSNRQNGYPLTPEQCQEWLEVYVQEDPEAANKTSCPWDITVALGQSACLSLPPPEPILKGVI